MGFNFMKFYNEYKGTTYPIIDCAASAFKSYSELTKKTDINKYWEQGIENAFKEIGVNFNPSDYVSGTSLYENQTKQFNMLDAINTTTLKDTFIPQLTNFSLEKITTLLLGEYNEEGLRLVEKNCSSSLETGSYNNESGFSSFPRQLMNDFFAKGVEKYGESVAEGIPKSFCGDGGSFFKNVTTDLFDNSKWMVFMEVPTSSSDFGIPLPPYGGFNILTKEQRESFYEKTENKTPNDNGSYNFVKSHFADGLGTPDGSSKDSPYSLKDSEDIIKDASVNKYKKTKGKSSYIPCTGSFGYEVEEVEMETINTGNYAINIPSRVVPKRKISLSILNDEFNTIYNYLNAYRHAMFRDFKTVLPYKHCVSIITLLVFSKQQKQIYCHRLLAIPDVSDLSLKGEAKSSSSAMVYETKWEIVGELLGDEEFSID